MSSTTSSQPIFAPTQAGTYTFEVAVSTQAGCVSKSRITICVKDIRVKGGDSDDDDCDHKSHSSKDCKHKDHKHHSECDHKSHSSKDCKNKSSKYDQYNDDDDDCDHKSHSSKDCKHKDHKHHSDCDHKSHSSKDCKNKSSKYDKYDKYDDDDDGCDHKSHNSKDCKHKDHKHHSDCDHKSHSSKDCKNKSYKDDKYDDHDDDDDDDDGSPKVYLCHVPPGNPNNPQTLRISINAVESHLRNHPGDKLGSCDQQGCTETVPTNTNQNTYTAAVVAEQSITSIKVVPVTTESDLEIKVLGNPSRSFFTIQMNSKHELPVQVRVFDINGRPLESKANQLPNSNIQIGHNLGSGTYYAEFLQGTRRKVIQLIKVR